MTEENDLQQGQAVRDPLVAVQSETGAVESTDADESTNAAVAAAEQERPESGESSESASRGPLRRVRLNPTVDESQGKAVPSLPTETGDASATDARATSATEGELKPGGARTPSHSEPGAAPGPIQSSSLSFADTGSAVSTDAERDTGAQATRSAAPERQPAVPVQIPPPVKELDAQLEAEIEAAMARGALEHADGVSSAAATEEEAGEERPPEESLEPGQHLTGRIQSIHGDSVFLELGYRSPGIIPVRQFVSGKKPEVGQRIEVVVDRIAHDEGLIYLNLPRGLRRIAGNWESLAKGQVVDCIVNRTNKGGLEVTVSGLRAFLPSSQVELGFVSDLNSFVGQKLRVEVVEVNRKKRNLVVSRRAYLQVERQEAEEKFWQTLDVGQTYAGRVKTIKDYGAFVDLGCVDGFLHIGEMSWQRIKHPSEAVKEGQTIDVKVLSLDREKKKIGLGMKQLVQNPWTTATERFPANSAVSGKVTRIADFGAFVELEPGIEGLIHVSELDHKHVRHASDIVKVHQVVTAQVLEVDAERKRISLSLKALLAKPEEQRPVEEEPRPQPQQRSRKGPLKGGTGTSGRGGLFGNPSDFA